MYQLGFFHRLVVCLLFLTPCLAKADETGKGADPELVQKIDSLLNVPELQAGFQGIVIQSLSDKTVLYERNADKVFLPASNNKLLTSGAALALLGTDFVTHTRLYALGKLTSKGVLQGDLLLRGEGDPLLSPQELDKMVQQVVQKGVRRVTGRLRYDDSLFDKQRLGDGWNWDDEPFYYSAQISALNLNENLVNVQVTPGKKVGALVHVQIGPTQRYTSIRNTALTGPAKSKSTLAIERLRGQNILLIHGSLPIDIPPKENLPVGVTIEEPARFTAVVFQERLQQTGIKISGTIQEGTLPPNNGTLLAEHISLPLSEVLKHLNKPSDNLIAECLLKTLGAKLPSTGTDKKPKTGAQVAAEWFTSIGMDKAGLLQADGSGLSRRNYVSPRNLVKLLTYLHTLPSFSIFYDSLPIAGVDGTLRRRMKGTAAEKNCHAKTGYVSHASSLSGYVTTQDGQLLVFSILMNHHLAPNRVCTAIQDKIVTLLAEYKRP